MRATTNATVSGIEVILGGQRGNSYIVRACVIKYKVAQLCRLDTKLLQNLVDDVSNLNTSMSA